MKIKVVNFPIKEVVQDNFELIVDVVSTASKDEFIVFPEGALSGYFPETGFDQTDFEGVDKYLKELQALSTERNSSFIIGSLVKKEEGIWNSTILFEPSKGPLIYNKVNLATTEREKLEFGSSLPVFSLSSFNETVIGFQMCRELKYPEQWRVIAEKNAKIIFHLNNAIGDNQGFEVWRSQLISRATETQRFVVSVNAADKEQKSPTMVISPKGKVLTEIQSADLVSVVVDLNLDECSNWYLNQARNDVVSVVEN